MSVTILRAADHRRMPWKNGKGETIEIAIHPETSGIDSFDWRISTASVTEDGPFSGFAGVDRNLSVLTGDGVVLTIGDAETRLTHGSAPFAFAGDQPTFARLIGSAITDLNIMTRRGRYDAQVTRIDLDGARLIEPQGTAFLFIADGAASIGDTPVAALDCARLHGPAGVTGRARLFLIEFTPATPQA